MIFCEEIKVTNNGNIDIYRDGINPLQLRHNLQTNCKDFT